MKDCFRTFSHTLIARENIWKHASKGDDRPLFKIWHNVRSVSFYVCIVIYIMFLELQPYFQKGGVDRKIGGDFFQVERGGGGGVGGHGQFSGLKGALARKRGCCFWEGISQCTLVFSHYCWKKLFVLLFYHFGFNNLIFSNV